MPCRRAWGRCRIQFRPRYGTPARLTGRVHEGDGQHCLTSIPTSSSTHNCLVQWKIARRRPFQADGGGDAGSRPATAGSRSRAHPPHRAADTPTRPARRPARSHRTSRRPAACGAPPAGSRPPPPSHRCGGRRSPACVRPAARLGGPVKPERLGRDAHHGRVEIQMQKVIAFQPGLKPHVATGCG